MVAIFESASDKRITDAGVVARIAEPGIAPVQKQLQPMVIAGAMSFGNYFPMRGPFIAAANFFWSFRNSGRLGDAAPWQPAHFASNRGLMSWV